jgi:signal transduction histidine kinase
MSCCLVTKWSQTLTLIQYSAIYRSMMTSISREQLPGPVNRYIGEMERLVSVVQELSLARTLDAVTAIVRRAAREITGAEGAAFILREGDLCYYIDEDAIGPLWKGKKFSMKTCVSGWVMLNKQSVFIEDIYSDPRVPVDAYRPTFVKSLAMIPIRTDSPIGAIGAYWARNHCASADEMRLLQALADTTSVVMENIRVHSELEDRVRERTAELESANKEMEAFSYAVSHDLRAPLRAVRGFVEALQEDCQDQLNPFGKDYLNRIAKSAGRMDNLIEDLLSLSQKSRALVTREQIDFSQLAREVMAELRILSPERQVAVRIADGVSGNADLHLILAVFDNLFSNAWKFTSKRENAEIEFGVERTENGPAYFVRDNGAGFDMAEVENLFTPFHRLHSDEQFKGTGVGLATVYRIIQKHGGRIWPKAERGKGATFYFTLS